MFYTDVIMEYISSQLVWYGR